MIWVAYMTSGATLLTALLNLIVVLRLDQKVAVSLFIHSRRIDRNAERIGQLENGEHGNEST